MQVIVDAKGNVLKPYVIECKDCMFFKPYKEANGYGECQSNHTFDGAFRENDFCSYGRSKRFKKTEDVNNDNKERQINGKDI